LEHCARLAAVRSGSYPEVDTRGWYLEAVEEDPGHLVIVMLSGMHKNLFVSPL